MDTRWTDALVARLEHLWAEGHSASAIGRELGFSKNGIVGKSHRLNLARRPSPIRLGGPTPKPPKVPRPPTIAKPRKSRGKSPPVPATEPVPVEQPSKPVPVRQSFVHICNWPMWGTYDRPTHRYCETAVVRNGYCGKHAKIAFVRVPPRPAERRIV